MVLKSRTGRWILFLILLAAVICLLGYLRNPKTTFSGSKTGNDTQFLEDFDVLNTTLNSSMHLMVGDTIQTRIVIEKGRVEVIVKNEKGSIAYQSQDIETSDFSFTIEAAGIYTFSITGVNAKGSIYFTKS